MIHLVGITVNVRLLILCIRFAYRIFLLLSDERKTNTDRSGKRVMLIGPGQAGQVILRELNHPREISDRVVCIIDDNRSKWNRTIDGIPVEGGRVEILYATQKYKGKETLINSAFLI